MTIVTARGSAFRRRHGILPRPAVKLLEGLAALTREAA